MRGADVQDPHYACTSDRCAIDDSLTCVAVRISSRVSDHEHEWERGVHMAEAFGVDGRRFACAICGLYR